MCRRLCAPILATWLLASPSSPVAGALPELRDVVGTSSRAVVSIHYRETGGKLQSLGSGFLISEQGEIVTAAHVLESEADLIVRFHDADEYPAEVHAVDGEADIALLRLSVDGPFPTLPIGDSASLAPGDWVIAIGSPFGFQNSATTGIVSAVGREIDEIDHTTFIQTDLTFNPGSSGGPLVNLDGEAVGLNSFTYGRIGGFVGTSFSVPIATVTWVVDQLREQGFVERGSLGIEWETTRGTSSESMAKTPLGARVMRIEPGGPAAAGGLEVGDIIVQIGDTRIGRAIGLGPLIAMTRVGTPLSVIYYRDARRARAQVVVGTRFSEGMVPRLEVMSDDLLGVSIRELSWEERALHHLSGGVYVEDVDGGLAHALGIRPGDILLKIGGQRVARLEDYEMLVHGIDESTPLSFQIHRGNTNLGLRLEDTSP